jgi:hypothetical protein
MAGDKRRVEVPIEALAALIDYADNQRINADSQFNCNSAEDTNSQAEFDKLIDALGEDWKKKGWNG